MPLKCPKCKKYMFPVTVDKIQIDYCKLGCKGIWLDNGEGQLVRKKTKWNWSLNKIIGNYKQKPLQEILKEEKRICPKCDIFLEQIEHPPGMDLYLDICSTCKGIFFDDGELKRYFHFLKEQDKFESLDLYSTDRFQEGFLRFIDILYNIR
ncbi:MAG: zf-TFIIB domain-containing protein [Cyanobacteriota bacterium]